MWPSIIRIRLLHIGLICERNSLQGPKFLNMSILFYYMQESFFVVNHVSLLLSFFSSGNNHQWDNIFTCRYAKGYNWQETTFGYIIFPTWFFPHSATILFACMNSYFPTLIHIKCLKCLEFIFICGTLQQYKEFVLLDTWTLKADIVSGFRE